MDRFLAITAIDSHQAFHAANNFRCKIFANTFLRVALMARCLRIVNAHCLNGELKERCRKWLNTLTADACCRRVRSRCWIVEKCKSTSYTTTLFVVGRYLSWLSNEGSHLCFRWFSSVKRICCFFLLLLLVLLLVLLLLLDVVESSNESGCCWEILIDNTGWSSWERSLLQCCHWKGKDRRSKRIVASRNV